MPFSAGNETKLKQKSLLACANSYVASSMAASLTGLRLGQQFSGQLSAELTAWQTSPSLLLGQSQAQLAWLLGLVHSIPPYPRCCLNSKLLVDHPELPHMHCVNMSMYCPQILLSFVLCLH